MTRLLAAALLATVAFAVGHASRNEGDPHGCFAPCAVVLPGGTQEDEFGLDYRWRDGSTPVVDVYRRSAP